MLVAVTAASAASAEIAPQFRRRAQDHAAEALMIRIVKVEESCRGQDCSFRVSAQVVCVLRSKSGLRPGDGIRIRYASHFGMLGSTVPRVEEGETTPAFLDKSDEWAADQSYVPAAHSASFSPFLTPNPPAGDRAICQP
jgi:hypothetical protein